MTEAQNRIIRLARKLFALAEKAGSAEEAHSAAMKARTLLSEHSLTMSDVEISNVEESLECREESHTLTTSHAPSWVKILFGGVRRGFGCDGFFSRTYNTETQTARSTTVFVGVEPDVSLALFTFTYLYRIGKRAPGMYKKKEKQKTQWRMGFAVAINKRLQRYEQTSQEKALVPIKEGLVKQYMAIIHPGLVPMLPPKFKRESAAFIAGYNHGRNVSLDTPVGASKNLLAIS